MLTQRLGNETQTQDEYIDNLINVIKHNPGSVDEVWFATQYGYPPVSFHNKVADDIIKQADKFRKACVRVSLQVSNTVGHGEYIGSTDCSGLVYDGSPAEHLVGPDGTTAAYSFCWRGENFIKYMKDTLAAYAKIKPHTIWFDDDFRPTHHTPIEYGCFCDKCIEKFNRLHKTDFTREALVKEINFGDIVWRERFIEFIKDGVGELMRELCKIIHKLLPGTYVGLQQGTMGGYVGDAGNSYLYKIIYEVTGYPMGVRPGGGAYTDQDMREFIKKGNEIERQARECQDFVTDIRPEIESLPYVSYGKSIPATCFESTYYLASGANAVSYAMMMRIREEYSWYEKFFNRFSEHKEYWKALSDINKKTVQSGVNAVYPDGRWRIKCKNLFDYAKSDEANERILRYISLPISYNKTSDGPCIIHSDDAYRISDKTAEELLKHPVITDAATVDILIKRGFEFNISVEKIDTLKMCEKCTKHPINADIPQKEWNGKFSGRREGWKITANDSSVEAVGVYYSPNKDLSYANDIATAIITTSYNAKWAVFGFDIWNRIICTSRRNQIFNAVEYISGKPLDARLISSFCSIILPRKYKDGKLASVSIVNCMPGESGEIEIKVNVPENTVVKYMSQYNGEGMYTVGGDGILKLPGMAAWTIATVFFQY